MDASATEVGRVDGPRRESTEESWESAAPARVVMGQVNSTATARTVEVETGAAQEGEKEVRAPALPMRVGKKKKKTGIEGASRLPDVAPQSKCKLRMLGIERVKDYLLMEEESVGNQERPVKEERGGRGEQD